MTSLFWAILAGLAFMLGYISIGGWFLLCSGTFDTLDGRIARHKKIDSRSGAFFDSVIDRYSDYFIFVGLIAHFSILKKNIATVESNVYLSLSTLGCLLGSHLISYSKERGANLGVVHEGGIMQRADRIIILALSAVFDPVVYFLFNPPLEVDLVGHHPTLGIGLFLIATFSNLTAIKRIRYIFKALD